jgi:hypothetical protein
MRTLDCGHKPSDTTGYGTDNNGKTWCYECIAEKDRDAMIRDGNSRSLPLYLSGDKITNWPGSLKFEARGIRKGRHNIARTQTRAYFNGPDGHVWTGVCVGEWTEVFHARRTKEVWRKA